MPNRSDRAIERLSRRASQKRLELLENILVESSKPTLNYGAKLPSARQALEDHTNLLDLIKELEKEESESNPKLPRRDDGKWANFFEWINTELSEEHGNVDTNDLVGVAKVSRKSSDSCNDDDQECALVTKKPFKKGETICLINRRVMLSTETVIEDEDLRDFIQNDTLASGMRNVILALHLLNEYSKGDKSYWRHYLAILPNKILPVLRLDKETFKFLLASSHIFDALKMVRSIARQYAYFYKLLLETNLPIKNDFTYQYYCWGVSTVCSRQNELPSLGARPSLPISALIPIMDMCNHDRKSNQALFDTNHSKLIATKDLNFDDEITINYGSCRSSGEFYIHNGFVPDEVPLDVVPIALALNDNESLKTLKTKLLKILNMPPYGRFRLVRNDYENRHKRDPHLTMFLIVYLMTKDETELVMDSENPVGLADKLYEYVQYAIDVSQGNNDDTQDDEMSAIVELQKRLSNGVEEYLAKRATIIIALIDRTLEDTKLKDKDIIMLLKHEKSLNETYLMNSSKSAEN